MGYLRKYLQKVGLVSTLLVGGVVGGLMAPLPSQALTVTIDGVVVNTDTVVTCDSGYNLCRSIPTGRYGALIVGNVDNTTNKARIMIGDNSTANSIDLLKMTGITFTPVVLTGEKTADVVVTHTYNAGGGNPKGDYSWTYAMAGHFDPPNGGAEPPAENVVGDRMKQIGAGDFAGAPVTFGAGLDTGVLGSPTLNNRNGSVTKTLAAAVYRQNCDTGSARCAPTVTQTYTITVVGADKLVLTDSFIAAGTTCLALGTIVPIPPHLHKVMLQLDPNAPNDVRQLSAWVVQMFEKYFNNPKKKALLQWLIKLLDAWIAKTVPGTCPDVEEQLNRVVLADAAVEVANCEASDNCEPAAPAPETGTIVIKMYADVNNADGTTNFEATGNGMVPGSFSLTSSGNLDGPVVVDQKTFTGLTTGEAGGSREIKQTSFPDDHTDGGSSVWRLDNVWCEGGVQWTKLYGGVGETLNGVRVDNVGNNQTVTCSFDNHHTHNNLNSPYGHPHPEEPTVD